MTKGTRLMKKCACFLAVIVLLAFQVGPLAGAQADVVGRLTQVEGRVDLLKGGQLPATPVKVDDEVRPGDVLRTKSLSKAQITFIDNSTLTVAPESRVGIEAYMYDPAQQKRNAVIDDLPGPGPRGGQQDLQGDRTGLRRQDPNRHYGGAGHRVRHSHPAQQFRYFEF